jgi:hypothetical protein
MIKELYIIKQALFHAPFHKQSIDDVAPVAPPECAFPFLMALQPTANFNLTYNCEHVRACTPTSHQ